MDEASLRSAVDRLRETLTDDVLQRVDARIEAHRRAVWVNDAWCCSEMEKFALKVWAASKPRTGGMWSVQYAIRGHAVNYCPFCGAFVGKRTDGAQ